MHRPEPDSPEPADAGDDLESLREKLDRYERSFRTLDDHIRALEGERQRLSAIVNYTDAGFVLIDAASRVVWTNTAFRERFGAKPVEEGEPLGLSCHQVVCNKSAPCADCPSVKLFHTGTVAHHEFSRFMGNGFHHIYVTAVPVHGLDGKLEQTVLMLQDLSDLEVLRRSAEALRTTEQRYRSIFEQAGAGMLTIRADGSLLQVNPSFCTMLGYTESELLRQKLTDFIQFADRDAVERRMQDVRAGKERVFELELRFMRRDLTDVWCQCTAVWQLRKNTTGYAVVLVQNISERKRAELELEQSQRRYETLVHSIDGIVWEADARAFRFTFVSNQVERMLGHPVERWLSQPRFWRNQIHTDDLERVVAALKNVIAARRGHEIEYRMVAADGRTVWVRDTVAPVVEGKSVSKLRGLIVDVTERKAAEEALRRSEEQLRQSQKMEAIGRLAGGIAHDFNNLLTAITGYGDMLLNKLDAQDPLRREAGEIYKAAQRAADLTGQLLAFSRQQVLQPKVLDLGETVSDTEMMLRRVIGEHITLITRHGAGLPAVEADPGQIHQVLLNLVVNARDAMQGGGTLTIETGALELGVDDPSAPPGVAPGAWVKLSVSDTGCGMDEETRARLFEPFFTTKEQGKGTGLGLSTVYGIVRQSGGHIVVESEPGAGSLFTILLPRVEKAAAEELPLPSEGKPGVAAGDERILLVEDDDAVRELSREVLEMYGYSVLEANNGVQALSVFEAAAGTIELMVTDLVMPEMGGRDLVARLVPEHPELRILYLSGYTDNAVLQQGLLDPGSSFLQKPFTPAELARKVRQALDGD